MAMEPKAILERAILGQQNWAIICSRVLLYTVGPAVMLQWAAWKCNSWWLFGTSNLVSSFPVQHLDSSPSPIPRSVTARARERELVVQERTQTDQPGSPKLASGTQPVSLASQVIAGRWSPAPDGCLPHISALPPWAPTQQLHWLQVQLSHWKFGHHSNINITTGPSTTDTGYGWLHVLLLFVLLTVWLDDHWKLHQPYCITFKLRVMFNTRVLSNYLNTDHNTEKARQIPELLKSSGGPLMCL